MDKINNWDLIDELKDSFQSDNKKDIENGIMCYCLDALQKPYDLYDTPGAREVFRFFKSQNIPANLEIIIDVFEGLFEINRKSENGIVFTPKYISDYIVESILTSHPWDGESCFIDPGCGGGIFLISAAEKLYEKYDIPIDTIIENYILGIDIEPDNVRCCTLALKLLSAKYGGDYINVKCNIQCFDSLKEKWGQKFGVDKISYVIGNPPYVNPHDMDSATIQFLKNTFTTTKTGTFNIFYAFIEWAMENISSDGALGYIIPNNFLSIKTAADLRKYLQSNLYIERILDFGCNMIFKPVRTYSCIVFLNKKSQKHFKYSVMKSTSDIEMALWDMDFMEMKTEELNENGWNLVDKTVRDNLMKIESYPISIKTFIRTGIATLKDAVFMVESDEDGYYKKINGKKVYIENDLVKPIYKIPELRRYDSIHDAERHIIFPYVKSDGGYVLIQEEELQEKYPSTYQVLLDCKEILDTRDKGRPNPKGWYAYGRTQGLNKYGKKLLFPTFSGNPRFLYIENEDALFCNGYGIFENEFLDLKVLKKILNSKIMDYYVRNTSYSIEGGYYCYQKKYIEKFSIPLLSKAEIQEIVHLPENRLDTYLWELYGLK